MTSSANVVRSLSADELASSLTRTDRNQNPPVNPSPTIVPIQEQKAKIGLLKRFRRALRLNAQSVRSSSRPEKSSRTSTHTPNPPPQPRRSPTAANLYAPQPHADFADAAEEKGSEKDFTAVMANGVPFANSAARKQQQQQQQPNASSHKSTPRARTWRAGLSRSNNTERSGGAADLGESKNDSRRFMSLSSSRRTFVSNHSSGLTPSASGDNASNSTSTPAAKSNAAHRSLPKRVFSSPPSLTGRTFGTFGSRRRGSVTGKNTSMRDGIYSSDVVDGDADSIKKITRAMTARNPQFDGRTQSADTPVAHNAANFSAVVEGATAGRVSFSTLMDAMFRLEERLTTNTKDMLIKYLVRQENMEALIDQLTVFDPLEGGFVEDAAHERERYRFSYVASMLLSNGPIQLRRSLFFNPKHLDRLVRVLGHGTPTDPVVVRSVCKVLLSVLRDSPEDTVRAMGRRKDFINALLSHIAITGCPEVCLSMLSTVRCQAELKFGPPNKPVVGMMADSQLVKTLCDKLAIAAENGPLNGTTSSTIENCSRVIVGIALRVLVIPRYEINDDDSDISYMKKFNKDLSSLDVFSQPAPILRLLDSGLAALACHDSRGYALSTGLTAVRYLLVTALNGQDSSLSTIRMQLLTVNTASYEAGLRARIPKLARVLEHARNGVIVETMWEKVENPLGVVRLKVLELIVVLLQQCSETTAKAIAKAEIPRILIGLFKRLKLNSLLQHFAAVIVELSFTGKFSCLRRAFLIDVRLMDHVMELWSCSEEFPKDVCRLPQGCVRNPVNYSGELLRMACAMHDFLKHDSQEVKELKREINANTIDKFERFVEGPIADKLKENGPLLCGPGELPARPMDNFAIDGYSSMDGSQGSLFLRSRGSSATVNT